MQDTSYPPHLELSVDTPLGENRIHLSFLFKPLPDFFSVLLFFSAIHRLAKVFTNIQLVAFMYS